MTTKQKVITPYRITHILQQPLCNHVGQKPLLLRLLLSSDCLFQQAGRAGGHAVEDSAREDVALVAGRVRFGHREHLVR